MLEITERFEIRNFLKLNRFMEFYDALRRGLHEVANDNYSDRTQRTLSMMNSLEAAFVPGIVQETNRLREKLCKN